MPDRDVALLVREFDDHLNRLGVIELKVAPLLGLGAWLALWLYAGFAWSTAPLLAFAGYIVFVYCTAFRYTPAYVRRKGQEFCSRWRPGTPEHSAAYAELAGMPDFQLKDDLLEAACGLNEDEYALGLGLLKSMAREVRSGADVQGVIQSTGEVIKSENAFLGDEFLSNCAELLTDDGALDAAKALASAAKMFQIKLTLESQEPGARSKEFARAVPIISTMYDAVARDALASEKGAP